MAKFYQRVRDDVQKYHNETHIQPAFEFFIVQGLHQFQQSFVQFPVQWLPPVVLEESK